MINSRNVGDLLPQVQDLCNQFLVKCQDAGIDVIITSTYRDAESQDALYASGRTVPGPIRTNARGGQSYHNWRVAFDFVPLVHGKPDWDNLITFERCGEIAESVGLEWAGHWTTFKEMAHCQFTGGLKLTDFQEGKTLLA